LKKFRDQEKLPLMKKIHKIKKIYEIQKIMLNYFHFSKFFWLKKIFLLKILDEFLQVILKIFFWKKVIYLRKSKIFINIKWMHYFLILFIMQWNFCENIIYMIFSLREKWFKLHYSCCYCLFFLQFIRSTNKEIKLYLYNFNKFGKIKNNLNFQFL